MRITAFLCAWIGAACTSPLAGDPYLDWRPLAADGARVGEAIVVVAQDDSGDLRGNDEEVLREGLRRLAASGGTLEIRPGRYLVRNGLRIPSGVTVRGTRRTVLAIPRPSLLTAPAPAGSRELRIGDSSEIVSGTYLEVLPPSAEGNWPAEVPLEERVVRVAEVRPGLLLLAGSLARDLPAGARVGCAPKMLQVDAAHDVTIEHLVLDGGRVEEIPMPGHHKRTAVWVTSHFSHEEGPQGEPSRNVLVRHCVLRNLYGRAVAMYNTVDSAVIGCRIRDVADEAIDFDHFTYRCRALGNEIRDAVFGITINDGSRNVVEYNRIRACETGIAIWWLSSIDPQGLNQENVLRHNFVEDSRPTAISLGRNCHRNVVRDNFIQGSLEVLEDTNEVAGNWNEEDVVAAER